MTSNWNFVSEDAETISLHDCCIDRVEEAGTDLLLHFDDGFDVTRNNPLNSTRRHRNTGPAAILLKNWRWIDGMWGRNVFQLVRLDDGTEKHIPLPMVPITREQFRNDLKLEILDFEWKPEQRLLTLDGNGWMECPPRDTEDGFADIRLGCDQLLFCWNGLPRDAWFQDRT